MLKTRKKVEHFCAAGTGANDNIRVTKLNLVEADTWVSVGEAVVNLMQSISAGVSK